MTKKEFIKRMNEIKKLEFDDFLCFTCILVSYSFNKKALSKYKKIINPYMRKDYSHIDLEFCDQNELIGAVRILALTTFEIECLESGIYKEF